MPRTLQELAGDPSPESWRLLCEALAELTEHHAMSAIAEIAETLDQKWDDELRATMCGMTWDDSFFAGRPDPRSVIVRFFRFDRMFSGRYGGGFRMRYDVGPPAMERLASSPGVRTLTTIDFGGHALGADGVANLAAGPHFESLRALRLSRCNVRRAGLAALLKAPFFSQLRELVLNGNSMDAGDLQALRALRAIKAPLSLETLSLNSNPIGEGGAHALAALRIPSLSKLKLIGCDLGVPGAAALAAYSGAPLDLEVASNALGDAGISALTAGTLQLRALLATGDTIGAKGARALSAADWPLVSLDLSNNTIDDDAAQILARSGPATLETLTLNDNDVTGVGLAALLGSERLTLRKLSIAANRIGAEGMENLGPTMRTLETLHLGDNRIGDAGIEHLAGAQAEELRVLGLQHNGITAPMLELLTGAPWFGNLTTLFLGSNALGPAAGVLLGARWLKVLTLDSCGLGDEGVLALAGAAFRPKTLNLECCDLTDRGVEALAESPVLSSVETLNLAGNRVTDRGIRALVRSPHLGALKELFVGANRLGDEGAAALAGWEGPLAFYTDGNPIGEAGLEALKTVPARCCP